jgi:hypothetical protein
MTLKPTCEASLETVCTNLALVGRCLIRALILVFDVVIGPDYRVGYHAVWLQATYDRPRRHSVLVSVSVFFGAFRDLLFLRGFEEIISRKHYIKRSDSDTT